MEKPAGSPMSNGDYNLVHAPDDWPGKKYRGRYCLEHHYVYWRYTGIVPLKGQCIHHRNGDTKDNRFNNLVLTTQEAHGRHHGFRPVKMVVLVCPNCGKVFTRKRRNTHLMSWRQSKRTFCSHRCVGLFGRQKHQQPPKDMVLFQYTVDPKDV